MGSIYKRRRRNAKTGTIEPSKKWYMKFRDGEGRLRREAAFTDRGKSLVLLGRRIEQAAEGKSNFGDPFAEFRVMPVAEHLAAYVASLKAKGVTPGHLKRVRENLTRAFQELGAHVLSDVTPEAIEKNLGELLAKGLSFKTRNDRRNILGSFFKWLIRRKRWMVNPTEDLACLKVEADPSREKRQRRALTADELEAVVEAAKVRPRERYLATCKEGKPARIHDLELRGQERSAAYVVAGLVGLRKGELAALRWGDLKLEEETPYVVLRATATKAKRKDMLPLAPAVVNAVVEWRDGGWTSLNWRAPRAEDLVFPRCVTSHLVHALRRDCEYAGVPIRTIEGQVDLHGLRHTCCSLLCRAGVPIKVTQGLMRHVSITTTARVYAHVQSLDRIDAVGRLPKLGLKPPDAAEGTSGQKP